MKDQEASMSSLFWFIKTFVVHLTAKRALERYCNGINRDVNISLFAVERSHLSIPSWPGMQDILRESFLSDTFESSTSAGDADIASKAIELIEDKIRNPPQKCGQKCRKMLANFANIIMNKAPLEFKGGLHCETVLATLSQYFKDFLIEDDSNADLISTCKVLLFTTYCLLDLTFYHKKLLHSDVISVSKLCCPVCWELFKLLGLEESLSLRGSHSTIYPVELPSWLPSEIVEEMYKLFLNHLRQEIEIMLEGDSADPDSEQPVQVTQRKGHASHESESNISIASTANSTNGWEDND
jgi:hypothetical protein